LYVISAPSSVGEGDASLPADDDPPPHEINTATGTINANLKVRICCFSIVGNDITPTAE